METEVPVMLQRAIVPKGVGFTFHSSRSPMKTASKEELIAMNGHMASCAGELSDARMDVIIGLSGRHYVSRPQLPPRDGTHSTRGL